ncbi:hypothetical protein D5S17_14305 [Pseudonocardiaceae bacterium YIM PH 21723]|nr:hypothetical protein D5S17_14305 [Pseudonocardiaceae bacterium YIM PH 21723]
MSGFHALPGKLTAAANQVGDFTARAARLTDAAHAAEVSDRSFGLIGQATVHSSYQDMVRDFGEYLTMIGKGTQRIEELLHATATGYREADAAEQARMDAIGRSIAGGR